MQLTNLAKLVEIYVLIFYIVPLTFADDVARARPRPSLLTRTLGGRRNRFVVLLSTRFSFGVRAHKTRGSHVCYYFKQTASPA